MLPPATRIAARTTVPRNLLKSTAQRRFASAKVPADRRRSWKSFAARWGLAIGGVYYYNTSPYFQGKVHEAYDPRNLPITSIEDENASSPSLEELAASRRARLATASAGASDARSATTLESAAAATPTVSSPPASTTSDQAPSDPNALEEEASQQGAFNEETGEINWDCPCLGGMAHGPCGPEFREAFSCFVFSKEEPKGMECIDKFKGMQNCFREHPDIYGAELMDDEPEDDAAGALDGVEGSPPGGAIAGPSGEVAPAPYSGADVERDLPQEGRTAVPSSSPLGLGGDAKTDEQSKTQRAKNAKTQVQASAGKETAESDLAPRDHVASSPKKTEK